MDDSLMCCSIVLDHAAGYNNTVACGHDGYHCLHSVPPRWCADHRAGGPCIPVYGMHFMFCVPAQMLIHSALLQVPDAASPAHVR